MPVMGMERRGSITLFSSSGQLSNGEEPGGETQSVAAFRREVNPAMGRSLGERQGRRPGDKSRMSREAPVRFREGLGVKFPRATRLVVGFQHRRDAERFLHELGGRMEKFGLALHPEKTRLIEFGRFAAENRRKRGEGKPETFTFLGFTHLCGRKRGSAGFIVTRKTAAQRLRTKLHEVRESLHQRRHEPIAELGQWLRSVIQGYFNYFGVSGNLVSLNTFRREAARSWFHALRCRSQRNRLPWERFRPIVDFWFPRVQVLHPYPANRFYAKHPK